MSNLDDETKKAIDDRLKIHDEQKGRIKAMREQNPEFVAKEFEKEKATTLKKFAELEAPLEGLIPLVREMRHHTDSLTAKSKNAALYLLFAKTVKTLRACMHLAKGGYYYEFMELMRSITENFDLIQLFIIEPEESANLKNWFEGRIIDNSVAREALGGEFDSLRETAVREISLPDDVFEKMKKDNYRMLSKYNHASYAALLDTYDVVNDDADFSGIAGYHHLQEEGARQFRQMLEAAFVYLKKYYIAIGDTERYKKTSDYLDSFSDIASPERIAQAQKVAEQMKERYKSA